jgi:hypothetical protein
MAKIQISVNEFNLILNSNNLFPRQISEIEADDDNIFLKIKTGWFALKSIRISVKFMSFNHEGAVFEIVQNRLMNKFDWLIHKWIESVQLPEHVNLCEYPKVHIDLNKVLANKAKGIRIDDISFEKGRFFVTISAI